MLECPFKTSAVKCERRRPTSLRRAAPAAPSSVRVECLTFLLLAGEASGDAPNHRRLQAPNYPLLLLVNSDCEPHGIRQPLRQKGHHSQPLVKGSRGGTQSTSAPLPAPFPDQRSPGSQNTRHVRKVITVLEKLA
ncbi:hypothetical protein AVEN_177115-1 [Araneus ventricosus]|uniref:Uncharacterized protein n=1 Tax=Araneus ventricosus TaxID=182803 RepID=A0A4Y2P0C9_ARAVE|nr:hypothetical protein AVEN_177115-1 [Araneus ventricosus]